MNANDQKPQPLPRFCTKKELEVMYEKTALSAQRVRGGINAIIADQRKEKKHPLPTSSHAILTAELLEFVETYGLPPGYFLPENY